jgi:putative transposase
VSRHRRLATKLLSLAARVWGLKLDQAKRLKDLERENERLKKAVSELTLDKLILKEALEGKY